MKKKIKKYLRLTKRTLTAYLLPIDPNRKGACRQCGKCCSLAFPCPFLDGQKKCSRHTKKRIKNCIVYPRCKREQEFPDCGYYFEK